LYSKLGIVILTVSTFLILFFIIKRKTLLRKIFGIILLCFGILFIIFCIYTCDSGQNIIVKQNLLSTNLSRIIISEIKIGNNIQDIDLSKYSSSIYKTDAKNIYNFEELNITTDDDGIIIKIQCNIYGYINDYKKGTVLINNYDQKKFGTIKDIIDILGGNYYNYWYDKEQALKANTYIDKDNGINFTIVYDYNSQKIVWYIISI
jgi:hypothetical protein